MDRISRHHSSLYKYLWLMLYLFCPGGMHGQFDLSANVVKTTEPRQVDEANFQEDG